MGNSELTIEMTFEEVVSVQSKKKRKAELVEAIRSILREIKWLIVCKTPIELYWFLDGVNRQETDKVGDLDNITKPILDGLTGIEGVFVDDSQFGSIYTEWIFTVGNPSPLSKLQIKVQFLNDYCMHKKDLLFVQYSGAVCAPFNVDFNEHKSILVAWLLIEDKVKKRNLAKDIKLLGGLADAHLLHSHWEFHKSRLGRIPSDQILKLDEFKQKSLDAGLRNEDLLDPINTLSHLKPSKSEHDR
jgi:Holliday junction resolvase RusA-like endonuclease